MRYHPPARRAQEWRLPHHQPGLSQISYGKSRALLSLRHARWFADQRDDRADLRVIVADFDEMLVGVEEIHAPADTSRGELLARFAHVSNGIEPVPIGNAS